MGLVAIIVTFRPGRWFLLVNNFVAAANRLPLQKVEKFKFLRVAGFRGLPLWQAR